MATYTSKKAYMYGTGRRKSSVARVHLFENGTGSITINGRDIDEYFGLETLKMVVRQPLAATETLGKVDIVATVEGGGVSGQAGALRHGVARALLLVTLYGCTGSRDCCDRAHAIIDGWRKEPAPRKSKRRLMRWLEDFDRWLGEDARPEVR